MNLFKALDLVALEDSFFKQDGIKSDKIGQKN
jgi:hypothetical protein